MRRHDMPRVRRDGTVLLWDHNKGESGIEADDDELLRVQFSSDEASWLSARSAQDSG